MKLMYWFLLLGGAFLLSGCGQNFSTIDSVEELSWSEDTIETPKLTKNELIEQSWRLEYSDNPGLNIYIPTNIPETLNEYVISREYSYKKENAILFALSDETVGYTKETNNYTFDFDKETKEGAVLDISVLSGEVEIRIISVDMNEDNGFKDDYIYVAAGETKKIALKDYYFTSSNIDQIQHLFIGAVSEYAIFDYEITLFNEVI